MKESGLTNVKGLMRIIIEKPFGDDLKSDKKIK
ncbi:glucose-6-phosphate 1-dehydrogenase [Staphylococcus epidermidis AU12-03]|nr:glucose-6-phosphate 1-dehydrogenase [Staphylococcus epidermidis]EKC83282.1 glucose-6-phosphate 1-dehydrogenase [Staphylococcus epidermidis AU12-03]